MFSPYLPLSDKFASLFMPLCQCTWGRYKGENMSNYTWTDSKWRPLPVKRDSCLIPNLVGTYLSLWSQKLKESLLQNTRLQGNGCRSPKSDDNMNDSSVKILYICLHA